MRKTKLTLGYFLLIATLCLIVAFFFARIMPIGNSFNNYYNSGSLFGIGYSRLIGDCIFTNGEGNRIKETYSIPNYLIASYIYGGLVLILFLNALKFIRRIKENRKVAPLSIRNIIYATVVLFSLITTLSTSINKETFYLENNEWVSRSVEMVVLHDIGITKDFFVIIGFFALYIILNLSVFLICLRYGDWSPFVKKEPKKKKNKEASNKNQTKQETPKENIKPKNEFKKPQEKVIFYDGFVPHIEDKLFQDLDSQDEEPLPLGENKQTNKTNQNVKKEEFTGIDLFKDYPVDAKKDFDLSKTQMVSFTGSSEDNQNDFNSKNMFLDDKDEFYGDEEDEDTPLEEEVPDEN